MVESNAWRIGEFLRIMVLFLWQKPEGATTGEIMDSIARSAHLSVEETIPAPGTSGFPRFEIETRAAMTALEKAGWLAREESRWLLTEEGQLACKDFRHAADFYLESQKILDNHREALPAYQLALEHAREDAWQQIQRYIQGLPRHEFRLLVRDMLLAMGYHLEWVAPPGKQRGLIDLVAIPDPLGVEQQHLMIHIHHSSLAVSAEDVQALMTATRPENIVLCLSSGGISEAARQFATPFSSNRIVLLDLTRFVDLWIEFHEKLPPCARQRFPLEAVYFLSLDR